MAGVCRLVAFVRGKYIIISKAEVIQARMLEGLNKKTSETPANFDATFRHRREQENFFVLMKVLDRETGQTGGGVPEFFFENIAKPSFALKNVAFEKVTKRDSGDRQTRTVCYT